MVLYNSAIISIKRVKKTREKLFVTAAVLVGSSFNYCYYHDTYVGEITYANIPSKVPEKKQDSINEETWSDENVKLH